MQTGCHYYRKASRGFTITEMLVSLAVLSVMGTLTLPSIRSWTETYQLDGAARQLATDLHLTRIRAITKNATAQLVFSGGSYAVEVDGTVESVRALPTGVNVTNPDPPVVFLARGTVQTGTQGTLNLSDGAHSRGITVNVIGGITVQ